MHNQPREPQPYEDLKQNRFKNLGELHKEWTEAGVKASRAPHTDVSRNLATVVFRGVLPGLREEELDCCPVVQRPLFRWEQVLYPRVWRKGGGAHSPSCLKSSVKFPQSVMIWGAMSSAGVGPLCFLKTNITAPVYQDILEHFMLPSADQLFKDADFIFQQDLAPVHNAKSTKSWLNDHGVGVLDWPANSPDLNPIENPTVKETWASLHLSSATNWSPPCHAALRQ